MSANPKCVRCGVVRSLHSDAGDRLFCPEYSTFRAELSPSEVTEARLRAADDLAKDWERAANEEFRHSWARDVYRRCARELRALLASPSEEEDPTTWPQWKRDFAADVYDRPGMLDRSAEGAPKEKP